MKKMVFLLLIFTRLILPVSSDQISPRFRVENDYVTPAVNPALLGFIKNDRFYFLFNMPIEPTTLGGGSGQYFRGESLSQTTNNQTLGYMMPLGRRWGFSYEFKLGSNGMAYGDSTNPIFFQGVPYPDMFGQPNFLGGSLGVGYNFSETMSIGVSSTVWNTNIHNDDPNEYMYQEGIDFSVQVGYSIRLLQNRMRIDVGATYVDLPERYIDFDTRIVKDGYAPSLAEIAVTYDCPKTNLILSVKTLADIYLGIWDDRTGHKLRLIPLVEYWVAPSLSFRTGFEYSHTLLQKEFAAGFGILGGLTVEFWKMQLYMNSTFRQKPSTLRPGGFTLENVFLIGVEFYPALLER